DDTASFRGWNAAADALALGDHARVVLEESYRCPPEITAYARSLFAPSSNEFSAGSHELAFAAGSNEFAARSHESSAGSDPISLPATGAPLAATQFPSACHFLVALVAELAALEAADPTSSIAVIFRTEEAARKIFAILSRAMSVRLALNGDFDF